MNFRRLDTRVIFAAAIMPVIFAAVFILCYGPWQWTACLTLTDGSNGRCLGAWPMDEGERFSVTFIHSVNQSPVTDVYEVRQDGIYVVETVYYDFGAGVQTEVMPGQTLRYTEDGGMAVSGFDQRIPELSYLVGTVSDHWLCVNHQTISLRDLCGRNHQAVFSYQHRLIRKQ